MYDHPDHSSKYERDPDVEHSYGMERDDSPYGSRDEEDFMPMTRRDIDRLYDHALRDTKTFISKREQKSEPKAARSRSEELASIGALAVGALGTAYLSQRFRQAGAVVPLGILLGGIGYGSAHFGLAGGFSDYLKHASIGAALASGVIWAAGYGSLAAERAQAQVPTTTTAGFGPQVIRSPFGSPPEQAAFGPAPYSPFAPPAAPAAPTSDADYFNLVTGRAA